MSQPTPSNTSSAANGVTTALPRLEPTPPVNANAQQDDTSATQTPAPTEPPSKSANASISGPSFPQYSTSTEELLKRVTATARAGTPNWEAARAKVLQSMKTSEGITTSSPPPVPLQTSASRARGRGRGGRGGATRGNSAAANGSTPFGTPAAAPAGSITSTPPSSGRGRNRGGRPRGRGNGRGGKRKRADSEESAGLSDASESYTPAPTTTKSGRNVSKPTQWVPTIPEPTQGTKRKRPYKRATESSLCKVCLRGTSPANNLIVFCDGCNSAYHQYCHHPTIGQDVIAEQDREWFCEDCRKSKETATQAPVQEPANLVQEPSPKSALVSGEELSLSMDEQKAYLLAQPRDYVVNLLLHACTLHPDLPVFPQNARTYITHGPFGKPVPALEPTSPTNQESASDQLNRELSTTVDAAHASDKNNDPESVPAPAEASHKGPGSKLTASATVKANFPSQAPNRDADLSTNSGRISNESEMKPPPVPTLDEPKKEIDPESGLELEPYDGYDTDPPAHYVKPGSGLAKTLRPEADDLEWLVDDNDEVFSHSYNYADSELGSKGMNGLGSGTVGLGDITMDLTGA